MNKSAEQKREEKELARQNERAVRDSQKDEIAAGLASGIKLVHVFNPDHPYGGLTIAFKKTNPYAKNGKMVTVAVSVCSDEDAFCRRVGAFYAIDNFNLGQTLQLPLLKSYLEEDIAYAVKEAFTALYEQI